MTAPTLHQTGAARRRVGGWSSALKVLGLLACVVPLGLLLMFAFGEGIAVEGWGHLLQAAPLVLLLVVAWWRPLVGGPLLTVVATGLAIWFAVTNSGNQWQMTVAMFFGPSIAGGLLFTGAGLAMRRGPGA